MYSGDFDPILENKKTKKVPRVEYNPAILPLHRLIFFYFFFKTLPLNLHLHLEIALFLPRSTLHVPHLGHNGARNANISTIDKP